METKQKLLVGMSREKGEYVHRCNVRIPNNQLMIMRENAKKYTDGNLSAWLRYTACNYKPSQDELWKSVEDESSSDIEATNNG